MRKKLGVAALLFGLGGLLYCGIELAYRGRTHWSMGVAGGLALCALGWIDRRLRGASLWIKALCGAAAITALEFVSGCLLNLRLGLGVWDYSDRTFNLMGQICPLFSAAWFLLALPGIKISGALERRFGDPR